MKSQIRFNKVLGVFELWINQSFVYSGIDYASVSLMRRNILRKSY